MSSKIPRKLPAFQRGNAFSDLGMAIRKYLSVNHVTQQQLATAAGVSRYTIGQLVNGRRNLTVEVSLLIAAATNTAPEYWLNIARKQEIEEARAKLGLVLSKIRPLR